MQEIIYKVLMTISDTVNIGVTIISVVAGIISIVQFILDWKKGEKRTIFVWGVIIIAAIAVIGMTMIRRNLSEVPDVVGKTYQDACNILSSHDLNYVIVEDTGSYIIGQKPTAGTIVNKGTTVELVIEDFTSTTEKNENMLSVKIMCISVYAQNTSGEYVPVFYSDIEFSDDMRCLLTSEYNQYELVRVDQTFQIKNIIPGMYTLVFSNSSGYVSDKVEYPIFNDSQIEETLIVKCTDDTKYEEYQISLQSTTNLSYMLVDNDGNKTVEDTFQTDLNGTFYFRVNWDLDHDIHVHTLKNRHVTVPFQKQYNGAHFIN